MKNVKEDKSPDIGYINQLTGVTPEQLLIKAKYMLGCLPASFKLTDEEKSDIINDSVISIMKKQKENKVPSTDYSLFKDYLFIVIKTAVAKAWKERTYKRNKVFYNMEELDVEISAGDYSVTKQLYQPDYQPEYSKDEDAAKQKLFNQALAMLPKTNQQMIVEVIDTNISPAEICRKNGKKKSHFQNIIKALRRNIEYITNKRKQKNKPLYERNFNIGEKIIEKHQLGWSIEQIQQHFGTFKSLIKYHISPTAKAESALRQRKTRLIRKDVNYIVFPRQLYYSQTEIVKQFSITVKGLKQLIADHQIPAVTKDVDLGEYAVKALYYLKEDIDKLGLTKR